MTPDVPSTLPSWRVDATNEFEGSLMPGKRAVEHFDLTYAGWAA
jgi:hypothetical protein